MRNNLPWTDDEIVTSYLQAANQKKQISVLADLNACKDADIRDVLTRAGIRIKKQKSDKTKKLLAHYEARAKAGFTHGIKIMLVLNGVRYTMREVAAMHKCSYNCVREHCIGTDVCVLGDTSYQVVRFQRSGS